MAQHGNCGSCKHYNVLKSDCRANPPKPFVLIKNNEPQCVGGWPPVEKHDWCGQFVPEIVQ